MKGPWETYEQSYRARIKIALKKSEQNDFIRGWDTDGIRDRIHAFLDAKHGLNAQFAQLDHADKRVVVHADLSKCKQKPCRRQNSWCRAKVAL